MHSRHPTGGMIFLRVYSGILEVNSFLVNGHLAGGTFNGACERGHGKKEQRDSCVSFAEDMSRLYRTVTVETGGWHYELYDDSQEKYKLRK